jgi:arylformamidase
MADSLFVHLAPFPAMIQSPLSYGGARTMEAIDFEAEYNNRARVPEHPEIFARWARDAAAYREEAAAEGRAELRLAYGASPRQTIDLFAPMGGGAAPLALFIHGGYWRSFDPSHYSHFARGLNARGFCVAVAGYDLCPQVRIADIIGQLRHACIYLWRRFGRRILVLGHSAGGHLTACMIGTDWKSQSGDLPADLAPAGLAISGLFDLAPLIGVSMNQDLRLSQADMREVSPLLWPAPAGRTLDAWCGALESGEFLRQNRAIAEVWGKGGVHTQCREIAGANHFTIIDPLSDPGSEMVHRLAALADRVQAPA